MTAVPPQELGELGGVGGVETGLAYGLCRWSVLLGCAGLGEAVGVGAGLDDVAAEGEAVDDGGAEAGRNPASVAYVSHVLDRAGIFDPATVAREMRVIADDLHCTTVRITGGDPERLTVAARYAAEAGSYASIPIEHIDWTPFDIVGVDAYRNQYNAATFREDLRQYFTHGKPVAVTEAGCCTFRGAGDWGAGGWMVIEEGGTVKPGTIRDEDEQVRYMNDLLPIFEAEGFDPIFWFSFAGFELPHRPDPRHDLDLGSYGIVRMLDGAQGHTYPGMPWEPKQAFHALARHYEDR